MIASDWVVGSVVVGDQGALVRLAGCPVPPDLCGRGEQPLRDPDIDAGQGSSLVAFQPKLAFEGLEGALDPLAPAAQRPMPTRLIGTVGTQQPRAIAGDQLLEVPAGQALVGQDDQPRAQPAVGEPQPAPLGVAAEQDLGDGQADQLGVAELWLAARSPTWAE